MCLGRRPESRNMVGTSTNANAITVTSQNTNKSSTHVRLWQVDGTSPTTNTISQSIHPLVPSILVLPNTRYHDTTSHKTTQRMNNSLSDHQYPRFYPITQTQITHSGESWWFIHLLKRWPKETVLSLSGNIVLIESKNSMTHWHSRWPRNFMLLSNLCVLPLHFLTHYNRTIWIQVFEFKYKSIYLLLDWLTAKKPNVQIHK